MPRYKIAAKSIQYEAIAKKKKQQQKKKKKKKTFKLCTHIVPIRFRN